MFIKKDTYGVGTGRLRKLRVLSAIIVGCCVLFINTAGVAANGSVNAESEKKPEPIAAGDVSAALLAEVGTGRVVYEYNSEEKLPAAGLTRLAALVSVCKGFDEGRLKPGDAVSVSKKAAGIGGTTAFLKAGEQMDAETMLLAAVMINAGDATHSLALAAAGSESAAVQEINACMAGIGVETNFSEICGAGEKLSASELAKIGAALTASESYRKFGTKFYEKIEHNTGAGATELANPNKLVKQYSGCIGVGTGSSTEAGYCGVFAAKRGNTAFIAVVLGAKTSGTRFDCGSALLDYGFASFRSVEINKKGDLFGQVAVNGSMRRSIGAAAESNVILLVSVSDTAYSLNAELAECLEAPITTGDKVGRLIVTDSKGVVLAEVALIADGNAEKAVFADYLKLISTEWIKKV